MAVRTLLQWVSKTSTGKIAANICERRKHSPGRGEIHVKAIDKTDSGYDAAVAAVTVPDLGIDPKECLPVERSDPCTIAILGASGDLTARKLIPALFSLYRNDGLPESFSIVGCARSQWDDLIFRNWMKEALKATDDFDESRWVSFAAALHYRQVNYTDLESFVELAASLKELDQKFHTAANWIFYIALPPSLYKSVAQLLGRAGLAAENSDGNGWSRIVVEKPFGSDLPTAVDLDRALHEYFQEHQIFRIDHYLAKETVQDILMFRFANSLFEPTWNRRYISHVVITATETLGVEHRAGYYEQSGVLRDMFQNHMMQLLALTAMEPPSRFEADIVRDEKIKVFRSLRPFPIDNLSECLTLGQYAQGMVDGNPVPAYREEEGVRSDSLTPTFAMMKVFLDNWRWQGVPFYLTSGKRLKKKTTAIAIQFKEVPHSMFRSVLGEGIAANRLIMGIYPDEKIKLTFQTKNPGARVCLRTVTMDFNYQQNYNGPILDAYAKVLIDCMLGDQMLFWRQDGVEACWSFLTPILSECESCGNRADMLHTYPAGSNGPSEVRKLLGYP
ncbi:MAG: glucose-6-phosphate dehydrogenase [Desulfobacterales bacterium]|nr:glucose-6-phosphate dehydrogenase [Desulfobacterales bacterium]